MLTRGHTQVEEFSDKFYSELRRKFYISPKSYLDMIQLYLYLLGVKRAELSEQLDTFITGLSKMEEVRPTPQTSKVKWEYTLKKTPSRGCFSGGGGASSIQIFRFVTDFVN